MSVLPTQHLLGVVNACLTFVCAAAGTKALVHVKDPGSTLGSVRKGITAGGVDGNTPTTHAPVCKIIKIMIVDVRGGWGGGWGGGGGSLFQGILNQHTDD